MSDRPVALNKNFRFGDALCRSCSASGPVTTLKQASCRLCRKPNCAQCAHGRTEADPFGLCRKCGETAPVEHPPNMVTFKYVDDPPAWLVRQQERERVRFTRERFGE